MTIKFVDLVFLTEFIRHCIEVASRMQCEKVWIWPQYSGIYTENSDLESDRPRQDLGTTRCTQSYQTPFPFRMGVWLARLCTNCMKLPVYVVYVCATCLDTEVLELLCTMHQKLAFYRCSLLIYPLFFFYVIICVIIRKIHATAHTDCYKQPGSCWSVWIGLLLLVSATTCS